MSAADVVFAPSRTTSIRRAAAPRISPAMQPSSKPPTFVRTSSPSCGSGRLTSSARRTISILCARRASEMFAPRPVTSSGVSLRNAAAMAALDVVFDMPISPGRMQRSPRSAQSFASAIPVSMDWIACARVMAEPFVIFAVPRAMLRRRSPGISSYAAFTPRSATTRRAPA